MKLLLISDEEDPMIWDYYRPGCLDGTDLILSAGDLSAEYLEFLVTMVNRPLIYVCGNHDMPYLKHPPEGCDCAEDRIIEARGLRILGLGGSMLYSGGEYQYTEAPMQRRIRRLRRGLRKSGGFDILLTHAPARGIGDLEDPCHRGFEAFLPLIDEYKPRLMVYGHIHSYNFHGAPQRFTRGSTTIINAAGRTLIEI